MKKREVKKTKMPSENILKISDEIQSIKKEVAKMKNDAINGKKINPIKFFETERRVEIVEKELNIVR